MSVEVHPTAVVDSEATLGVDVEVGAGAFVGPGVELGDGTVVGPGAMVMGPSTFGPNNRIHGHACVGGPPQDLKYDGEPTVLEVGAENQFRELCTVNRGTVGGGGRTVVGDRNLFMAYCHVGHDCRIGSHTVFANSGTLAGHVTVEDWAIIGAFCVIQQFLRIGAHAYLGAYTRINRDVLPFAITVGQNPQCMGVNKVGMERRGFDPEAVRSVSRALKTLTRGGLGREEAMARLRADHPDSPEVSALVAFVEASEHGVIRNAPGRGKRFGKE